MDAALIVGLLCGGAYLLIRLSLVLIWLIEDLICGGDHLFQTPAELRAAREAQQQREAQAASQRAAALSGPPPATECAWCTKPPRGTAIHTDGRRHPSCGTIYHGHDWRHL